MASQINLNNLSLNTEEAKELSSVIYEKAITQDKYIKAHDLHQGIQYDTQIPIIGTMGLLGKELSGCTPTASTSKIPISEKKWTPKLVGDRIEHCSRDLDPLLKLFGKVKKNSEFYNKIKHPEMGLVIMSTEQAIKEMITRVVWFGDTAVDTTSNGGYLKDGVDKNYFNTFDGLFSQMFAEIPTTADNYVAISENSGSSYNAQRNLADDFAFRLFSDMLDRADGRLKQTVDDEGSSDLKIHVTPDIADNWRRYKTEKSLGFTLGNAENGGLQNSFNGIEIVTRYDWGSIISGYQDNGTKYNLPNRAVLTTSSNIPVGTVSENSLSELDSFYDQYKKVNVLDFNIMLDAKHLQDYMTVIAY